MSTKTVQGKLWSISPQNWSTHFEPYFLPLYKTALDQFEIHPETMLLDAGCGSGMFSSMAIDAGAQVIGIDAAPGLLEIARQALKETHRVLKPGGKLVLAIWDKPENSDGTTILKAISTLLPPPLPGTPGPFALSEDGRMENYLEETGFELINRLQISCPFIYHSLGNGIRSFIGTGPAAALQPYSIVDDIYYQQNSFLLFIAKK